MAKVIEFFKKVFRWIKNENWIESLQSTVKAYAPVSSVFVALYLMFDISGKVPVALHINLVTLSATLGGLVFTGASFISKDGKDIENRKPLMNCAKQFIIATFLFFVFYVFFTFIKDMNINPLGFDFSKDGLARGFLFWVAALGIYGGSCYFTLALVNLMFSLKKIR
ncbi:MAG: hypothetical protein WC369_00305 [Dehalococcoidales bacterium]|jgi:hypothetical protein